MNNYAYLIKAKAKATDSKSLFCWFSAKSDSRAERKILDLLEDAEIEVGRGADHQLPIRTHWLIVDDMPEEDVLDDTWCDRYELSGEDGLAWQKIVVLADGVTESDPALPEQNKNDTQMHGSSHEDFEDTDDEAMHPLATMPFRTQLLAQYTSEDRHTYHITNPHRNLLSVMEMDQENNAVQDLILAAENVPDIKAYDIPGIWKFTSAMKKVFPVGKRHELGKQIQFAKLWFETGHLDRGILVKEWANGNCIISVNRTPAGANAGGGNITDRSSGYSHTLDTLDVEIALATLPMDFDIYNIPVSIHRLAKEIVSKKESPFKEWSDSLRCTPGILDYSRAAIFALVREASSGITPFPDRLRGYINANLTEHKHDTPSAEMLEKAGHISSAEVTLDAVKKAIDGDGNKPVLENLSTEYQVVGAELVKEAQKGQSDTELKAKPEVANLGAGIFSVEGLMASPAPMSTKEEATNDVQVEKTHSNEVAGSYEMPKSKTTDEHTTGNAESGAAPTAVNIAPGHHNGDEESSVEFVHVMVDLETMGKNPNAPIVSIGAVVFDPATGKLGETFYKVIILESAISWGAEIDPSTVIWWLKQSSEARSAIVNDDAIKLDDALIMFTEFILENITGGCKKAQVWGNGATFDNTILRSSFERTSLDCPWAYWNDRDVRTMVELGKAIGFNPKTSIPFEGDRHNALSDAQHQARYVSAIWQRLIKN